ncbi:MAG: archaellin/type IV pilin N-terminal domain-containing protein [Candidatus Anstonellales archaeon]
MKTKSSLPPIFLFNKKAISNILAVVLLVIITLVVGALFFIFGRTMFSSLSSTHDFEITDATILLDSAGNPTLLISIKNVGNSRLTISQVSIGTWSSAWNQVLDAGQQAGKTFTPTGTFTSGQKVIVRVSATYDSTPLEKITQVVVQG